MSAQTILERIVYRFEQRHGPAARESYRRYFDLKRAAEGRPPLWIVEIDGQWCAVETTRGTA